MRKQLVRWGFTGLLALTAGGCATGGGLATNTNPVMTVNGQPVAREEFKWFMEQERAGVFQWFKTKHNLEDGKDFWNHVCDGTTPRALLRTNTIRRVTREKVEHILFAELGLIKDSGYPAFIEGFEKLNRDREQAAKQGRVLYGPVRYTQLQFYGHWKATLQIQAVEKLSPGRLDATDNEDHCLQQQYQDLLGELARKAEVRTDQKTVDALLP